jgi:hypothetical protein
LRQEGRAQRLTGMRILAGVLADRRALRSDMTLDEAADVLWVFNDPALYTRLVLEQSWDEDRYEGWLASTLVALLLAEDQRNAS